MQIHPPSNSEDNKLFTCEKKYYWRNCPEQVIHPLLQRLRILPLDRATYRNIAPGFLGDQTIVSVRNAVGVPSKPVAKGLFRVKSSLNTVSGEILLLILELG